MLIGRLGLDSAHIPHGDRHGLLYLEHGKLYVSDGTVRFVTAGTETMSAGDYSVAFQTVSCFLLGPGTTVSHDAFRLFARHGTGVQVIGENGSRHYASMPYGPDASALARRQARAWADEFGERLHIARRMYAWRLGEVVPSTDINVLRGIEGQRVKETYRILAERFGISWRGRRYDRAAPEKDDAPNMAINHAAAAILAAAKIASAAVGAIPQLGFIHEDSGYSFCLDIADLFRDALTIPLAFSAVQALEKGEDKNLERLVRVRAGHVFHRKQVVPQMIDRIKELFDADDRGHDA
jgi:CRISPR-associated protein Cas1